MQNLNFYSDVIKLGKKGQLTLPKKLRDFDKLEENDEFIVQRMPGGDITLVKRTMKTPEDMILEAIERLQPFDATGAWEEVLADRRKERS